MLYLLNGLPAFFGTFNVTGNIIVSGQGLFADGTNAAPSISFQSDPDTGVYLDAANTLGIATAGAGTVLFSSSAGIGKIKAHGTRVLALEAGTGNTNITLTPSGTGQVAITGYRLQLTTNSGTLAPMQFVDTNTSGRTWQFGPGLGTGDVQKFTLYDVTGGAPVASFMSGGKLLLNTTTDSGALLQIGTNTTTSAGGMVFGTDTFLYRYAPGALVFGSAQTNTLLSFSNSSGNTGQIGFLGNNLQLLADVGSIILKSGNATALTLDSSQNATFAGTVKPQLATTAGAPAYAKGALYFDTTLNKLRVGGATAWETVTSV